MSRTPSRLSVLPVSDPAYRGSVVEPPRWRALGTYVELHVADPEQEQAAIALAHAVLAEVDLSCSRFRDDSDLMRANRAAGEWIRVSPVLVGALRAALWAADYTDGLVDPGLGELIVAAGYDRTFTALRPTDDPAGMPWRDAASGTRGAPRGSWRDIELGEGLIRIPRGLSVDLGAVGKAYAADLVALSIADRLGTACVVSVGGDVRTAAPEVEPGQGGSLANRTTTGGLTSEIAIAEDLAALQSGLAPVCVVPLSAGGIATSSITARRWVRGGTTWHHILDPRSGGPAPDQWRAVTAYGSSAAAANAASTASLVLGSDAVPWLQERGIPARLVAADGTVTVTQAWEVARHTGCMDAGTEAGIAASAGGESA